MQDVFLRVIRHRITYKPDHKFAPWIYQVSRNVYSDFVKKEGRIKSNFIDLNNINTEVDSFLDDKEKADQVKVLQKALTKLSAEHREVLILTRYQNMKNKEVAKILDCKENAVKAKVHRAMKKLRSIYFEIEKN